MTINLISLTHPASPAAEAYRQLRANLLAAGRETPLRTLLVVAAGADPDKAAAVANLAVTFARIGKRVILADCDLRNPAQHAIFGLSNAVGVTTAVGAPLPPNVGGLNSPQDWGAGGALQATAVPGLRVLPAGPQAGVPADLLASPAMGTLIARLRDEADIILFDAPPVLFATDAAELAIQVDGVLLTVRAGHTRRDEAQRAKELLEKVGARIIGAALVNA
jgi:non-specific protein-tyrosine kinase